MSYRSAHQLIIVSQPGSPEDGPSDEEVRDLLREMDPTRSQSEWEHRLNNDRTDWPERQMQMARVSLNWPRALFIIDIQGEEDTDLSREYHRNGLVQAVLGERVYPDFNPSELVRPQAS